MRYSFPLAFMANNFAMTALMIGLVLAGKSELAADVGIVQGATIALFFAFSANARSLVLNPSAKVSAAAILFARLVLLVPLAAAALYLSVGLGDVALLFAVPLVLRRGVEWLEEVHLSELERTDRAQPAAASVAINLLLLAFVLFAGIIDERLFSAALWLWAIVPVFASAPFLRDVVGRLDRLDVLAWRNQMLPHLGSSMIIGIAIFVFRWLIVALTGKEIAGDLFAAFAIGSFAGSAFIYALGPTLALQEQRHGVSHFPAWLSFALYGSFFAGVLLFASSLAGWEMLGKSELFWGAAGLSLIASPIQVQALKIKLSLLQHTSSRDTFGPDVLSNVFLVASVPFLNKFGGPHALMALYLLSAALNLAFYASAGRDALSAARPAVVWLIPTLLLLPVFFLLNGQVFADPSNRYDTFGDLWRLPIPISIFACYGGIVLLGQYERARFALTLIFVTFLAMLIAAILATQSAPWAEKPKLILLIQFVLPIFALVLGQQYAALRPAQWQRAFLYVLLVLVPIQLVATWLRGKYTLSPYLYLFSIHQHLQYVPAIFVSCYVLALYSLWETHRRTLLALAAIMGVYVIASASLLSVLLLFAAVPFFSLYRWATARDKRAALLSVLALAGALFYFQFGKELLNLSYRGGKSGFQSEQITTSVGDRIDIWRNYSEGITEGAKAFLLGHAEAPPRTQFPGAHNYYLDFAYNFGVLPLIPLLAGIAYTLGMMGRNWKEISRDQALLGLCGVVVFLLLPDNLLKVGMRQPYPGIMTFFLWGMLLSTLFALDAKKRPLAEPAVAETQVALSSTR